MRLGRLRGHAQMAWEWRPRLSAGWVPLLISHSVSQMTKKPIAGKERE